jgi:outer membrane murein-binding lipoprotein Lpp
MTMTLSESKMPLAFVLATCLVAGGSFTHAQRAGSGTGRAASEKAVDPDDTKAELDRRADLIRSLERKLKSLEEEVAALRESAGPDFGARDRANAEADPFGAPAANSSRAEARGSANASGRAQGTASGRTGGAAAEGGFVGQGGRGAGFGPRGAAGMMGSDPFRGGRGAMGGAGRAAQGDPFQQNQGSLLPQGNAADPVNRRGGLMGRGMGGMMGGAGMGDMSRMMGMMGGGMAAPEGLRYTHSGGVHALQTDDKRVVTAYSVEHDTAAVYEAPEGVTLEPIIGADVLAPLYEGGKATELAVFSAKQGRWFTERLEQPADAIEGPLVGTGLVAYRVGPRVYAFSGEAGRWGVITPQTRDGEQSVPILGPSVVTLIDGKSIHLFSRKTGNWTTLRAEGTNPEANDPNARGRREAPPTDLEK